MFYIIYIQWADASYRHRASGEIQETRGCIMEQMQKGAASIIHFPVRECSILGAQAKIMRKIKGNYDASLHFDTCKTDANNAYFS